MCARYIVVADYAHDRVSQFTLKGVLVRHIATAAQGLRCPSDVVECEDGFIVANYGANNLIKVTGSTSTVLGEC